MFLIFFVQPEQQGNELIQHSFVQFLGFLFELIIPFCGEFFFSGL